MSFETKEDVLLQVLTQERPKCTYCGKKMRIWEVPQFPFEDGLGWGTPYLFVCFNNRCPMYEQGWDNIRRNYGNGFLLKKIEKSLGKIHERFSTRECPFCSEIIRKKAKVCKYCGGVLPVSEKIPHKQGIFDRQS